MLRVIHRPLLLCHNANTPFYSVVCETKHQFHFEACVIQILGNVGKFFIYGMSMLFVWRKHMFATWRHVHMPQIFC